jgi:transcriptional regulator with XRE-family HTH domain
MKQRQQGDFMTLKQFRELRGLRSGDAARELGVTYVQYWRWENGKTIPEPHNMRKISEWSKGAVSANDLVGGSA